VVAHFPTFATRTVVPGLIVGVTAREWLTMRGDVLENTAAELEPSVFWGMVDDLVAPIDLLIALLPHAEHAIF